jgi:hypothetical protein
LANRLYDRAAGNARAAESRKPLSAGPKAAASLARLLDAVDDGKLRQVMRLVEASRQRCRLEPALAAVRPRLRKLRPMRPLTLSRLLTVPFEANLTRGTAPEWPFAIGRERLGDWHHAIIAGVDPGDRNAAQALIDGRAGDDQDAIIAAGRRVWPDAARLLAMEPPADEQPEEAISRLWAADLSSIAVELVPLLWRLPPPLVGLDAAEQEVAAEILALAGDGPPDRLGLVAMALLQRAVQPALLARALLDLAPATVGPRLRPVLDQLLRRHRADLDQRLLEAAAAENAPLDAVADEFWRLADALAGPEGQRLGESSSDPETAALRERAAIVAEQHYAASIAGVVAPLPETAGTERQATVKAREDAARKLARLGRAAKRLAPKTSVERMAETAFKALLGPQNGAAGVVDVDDARLVEILLGPDVAWQLLRPWRSERSRLPQQRRCG